MKTKRSEIYLEAWLAAEKVLPPDSMKLIKDHDALFGKWREAGFTSPTPPEVRNAADRIESDPLASIAFELRQKCNHECAKEYAAEHKAA